jgi:hypothetical protein
LVELIVITTVAPARTLASDADTLTLGSKAVVVWLTVAVPVCPVAVFLAVSVHVVTPCSDASATTGALVNVPTGIEPDPDLVPPHTYVSSSAALVIVVNVYDPPTGTGFGEKTTETDGPCGNTVCSTSTLIS